MADLDILSRLKLLKNSIISVGVDEVLPDILVVTYSFESKLFKGVLLDSTKRNLPCGVNGPANFPDQIFSPKAENVDDDRLFAVSQRFTYFQGGAGSGTAQVKPNSNHFDLRRAIHPPARYRGAAGAKMTVRLRPRQVLCSKCRSICNENSENVDHSAGRGKKTPPFSENQTSNREGVPTLIPKLARLKPNEITNAINGKIATAANTTTNTKPSSLDVNYWLQPDPTSATKTHLSCASDGKNSEGGLEGEEEDDEEGEDCDNKMVLRKKRSVGSMEDLWDESVFEEAAKRTRTTPVIKISFGGQGEGEVVKIPSKLQNCSESEAEDKQKVASAKAAKRALKKAKKEARRKLTSSSPVYEAASAAAAAAAHYRRHRHKVKHKKKHKLEQEEGGVEVGVAKVADIKSRCLKQKLSISLRRLNATAYASGGGGGGGAAPARSNSGSSPSSGSSAEEALPDFPPSVAGVPGSSKVTTTRYSDGRLLAIGDIVWGKIHGFPWWPGKVLSITVKDESAAAAVGSQAHVAWYGSSTSSLMPCDELSPFLETFKSRFNKKKKSSQYKEAIKQATSEASTTNNSSSSQLSSSSSSQSSSSSTSSSSSSMAAAATAADAMPVLTQLLSASPTQVHVVS